MGWKRKRLEAMGDEDINDVDLVGTDGGKVPCCKGLLATISPVFKGIFYRGFREQKTDRCSLDFHSLVITMIVKFCYCGELDMGLIFCMSRSLEEEASLLIGLREAGRFFEFEDIFSATEAKIGNLVFEERVDKKQRKYAFAFLTELFKRNEDKKGSLWLALCSFVVKDAMDCFDPGAPESNITDAYYHLHPALLSIVLQETRDTYAAVKRVKTWFCHESKSGGNGYSDEEKRALIEISENINLKKLSPRELSKIKPCSLFSSERILEAFVHQCKGPETTTGRPRTQPKLNVFGAEMEHLNGVYRQELGPDGKELSIFFKKVKHNGIKCRSVIHRPFGCKWFISITKQDKIRIGAYKDICNDSIQMHVYESPCSSLFSPPPFNGWKSLKGTDKEPTVGWISQ